MERLVAGSHLSVDEGGETSVSIVVPVDRHI